MDLFDTGAYFSSKAPVLAASRPLLKSAMCAVAAKHMQHICRTLNNDAEGRVIHSKYAILVLAVRDVDWRYQSVEYYDLALRHLKLAIDAQDFEKSLEDKEEVFAAVAILCTYELMDAPGTEWRAHLSALPLFSPEPDPVSEPHSAVAIPRTPISGPIFWSLARQDLLCACRCLYSLIELHVSSPIQSSARYQHG